MRVAAAGKELFGQRDQRDVFAQGLIRVGIDRAGAWRPDGGPSKGLLHADARRSGEYIFVSGSALPTKCLIRRILRQQPTEVGLRTEVARRSKTVQSEIVSLRALEGVVPLITNEGKTWTSHTRRKRQQRYFARREACRKITRIDSPEIEAIRNRTRSRPRAWFRSRVPNLLPHIDLSLQPL